MNTASFSLMHDLSELAVSRAWYFIADYGLNSFTSLIFICALLLVLIQCSSWIDRHFNLGRFVVIVVVCDLIIINACLNALF